MIIPVWLLPVLLRAIIGHVFQATLIKKVASQHSRTSRFLLTYIFCTLISASIALIFGQISVDSVVMVVFAIGFFNALAAYAHWIATDISMSRASLYLVLDDVVAMGLGYYILSEGQFLNNGLAAGISWSIASALFFLIYRSKKAELEAKLDSATTGKPIKELVLGKEKEKLLLKCVFYFSITWGIAMFSMKYFGMQNVHPLKYIWAWYFGSLIGAATVLLYSKTDMKEIRSFFKIGKGFDDKFSLTSEAKGVIQIFSLSACMVTSVGVSYWAYKVAHLIVVQPSFLLMEMIAPTLIGLYYFKEIKELDGNEKLLLLIGILGGILVTINS